MGDMLYSGPNSTLPVRVHGAFVRDQEVHAVVQDWKARGRPQYVDGITSDSESEGGAGGFDGAEELDPLFDQAVQFVTENAKRQFLACSVSSALVITVQRVLSNRWKRRGL
ncbi:DNA translocase FtsK [Escherichia coli]|nr:DNA translocase FtsK [Escherichia coli]